MHSSKPSTMATRPGQRAARMACLAALACAGAAQADYVVPAGETYVWGDGALDLACENLIVNGTFTVHHATVDNIARITIGSGGTINATNAAFDVAQSSVHSGGTFTGAAYTPTYSCNGGGQNPPPASATPAPVPTSGPLGLALMGLLLGAALPVRRWLQQRGQAAR